MKSPRMLMSSSLNDVVKSCPYALARRLEPFSALRSVGEPWRMESSRFKPTGSKKLVPPGGAPCVVVASSRLNSLIDCSGLTPAFTGAGRRWESFERFPFVFPTGFTKGSTCWSSGGGSPSWAPFGPIISFGARSCGIVVDEEGTKHREKKNTSTRPSGFARAQRRRRTTSDVSLGYRSTSFELARERRARRKRRARGRRPALERVNEKGGGKSRSEVTPFVTSLTQRAYRLLARSVRDVGDGSLRSVELLREERARSDASPGCPRTSGRRETSLVALTMHSYARARLDNQDAARAPGDLPRDDARREARGR